MRKVILALVGLSVALGCNPIVDAPVGRTSGPVTILSTPLLPIADGSRVTLKITTDIEPRPADPKVVLTTTLGTFVGGTSTITVPVSDSGFAYAVIQGPTSAGTALISAVFGGTTQYHTLVFASPTATPVFPARVQLTTSGFGVKARADTSITLTAQLLGALGASGVAATVSPGVVVTFSADSARGTTGDFGQFSPRSATSSTSTITALFSPLQTGYRGTAIIRVRAARDTVVRTDSIMIQVLPP